MENLEKGLVSIIVPIYNKGNVIHRLFDSILKQTYTRLELILINDGSTDDIITVIDKYRSLFIEKGFKFCYQNNKNMGVSEAMNSGLQIFTGEYICWPDADDYLTPDSIEKKKKFLDTNLKYEIVRTDSYVYKESNLNQSIGFLSKKSDLRFGENLFDDYILENGCIWFAPGCFMVRGSAFLKIYPERKIYPSRSGQNYQMILPFIWKKKMGYIDEALHAYVLYASSLSALWSNTYEKAILLHDGHQEIVLETLKRIPMDEYEKEYYSRQLFAKYLSRKVFSAFYYRKSKEVRLFLNQLLVYRSLTKKERIVRWANNIPLGWSLLSFTVSVRRLFTSFS